MRKASRLFDILQILRLAPQAVTAAQIASALHVVPRTIYRDIAELQALRVPIEGGRGIGYLLRDGFTLPPLMFSVEETEALMLGLALLQRTADTALKHNAQTATTKIAAAIPAPLRATLTNRTLHAWGSITPAPIGIDLGQIRQSIRDERKLRITYIDEAGSTSTRTLCPIALVYYATTNTLVAWCELRQAIRSFRTDRVQTSQLVDAHFHGKGDALRALWVAGWQTAS